MVPIPLPLPLQMTPVQVPLKKTAYVFNENPDFRISDTAVCKKNTIQFFALVADPLRFRNYLWDFGDGTQWNSADHNTGGNANHYYPIPAGTPSPLQQGILTTVSLLFQNEYASLCPKADFSALNTSGCKGLTTTFNDLSQSDGVNNIVSKTWDFGDGTVLTDNATSIQHTYATPGTYTVKLTVTDAFGCMDTLQRADLIHATNPIAGFHG